jgi:multidrug transporter EmrE-like cation transporter
MPALAPLLYGVYMASIDTAMLGLIKAISLGWFPKTAMIIPTAIYALQPWLFSAALKYESMVVMNLLWDVMSDIMVTASGLIIFKEKVSRTKLIGVFLAIVSIFLMSCCED